MLGGSAGAGAGLPGWSCGGCQQRPEAGAGRVWLSRPRALPPLWCQALSECHLRPDLPLSRRRCQPRAAQWTPLGAAGGAAALPPHAGAAPGLGFPRGCSREPTAVGSGLALGTRSVPPHQHGLCGQPGHSDGHTGQLAGHRWAPASNGEGASQASGSTSGTETPPSGTQAAREPMSELASSREPAVLSRWHLPACWRTGW